MPNNSVDIKCPTITEKCGCDRTQPPITAAIMPKEMINVTIQRKQNEPWGMVIVGGKDQALTVKLGRIKVQNLAATSLVHGLLSCPAPVKCGYNSVLCRYRISEVVCLQRFMEFHVIDTQILNALEPIAACF